jgi:hypothetical protein
MSVVDPAVFQSIQEKIDAETEFHDVSNIIGELYTQG